MKHNSVEPAHTMMTEICFEPHGVISQNATAQAQTSIMGRIFHLWVDRVLNAPADVQSWSGQLTDPISDDVPVSLFLLALSCWSGGADRCNEGAAVLPV